MPEELKDLFENTDDDAEKFKAIKEFYGIKGETDIRTKTIIKDDSVLKIIKLIYFGREAEKYDTNNKLISSIINETILENYYTLKISVRGEGRKQFFSTISGNEKKEKRRLFGIGDK